MWFSKVTSLDALCDTTTSFDDEPCGRQKKGVCPRVVEGVRNTLGEREKKDLQPKKENPQLYRDSRFCWCVGKVGLLSNSTKVLAVATFASVAAPLHPCRPGPPGVFAALQGAFYAWCCSGCFSACGGETYTAGKMRLTSRYQVGCTAWSALMFRKPT